MAHTAHSTFLTPLSVPSKLAGFQLVSQVENYYKTRTGHCLLDYEVENSRKLLPLWS
jgi:hypothetical protein